MNVLHVSSATSWRGGEQQIAYLIPELQQLGVQNHLFTPYMSALSERNLEEYCYIHTYKKRSSFNPLLGFYINNIIKKYHIDLVHVHDSHGLNYSITASMLGTVFPIIYSRRTDFLPKSKQKYNFKGIKAIICVSEHVRTIMSTIIKKEEILTVIHDGIDLNNNDVSPYNLRQQYNIQDECTLIANASALADHKDYETFIKTADELVNQRGVPCHFFVIGQDAGSGSMIKRMINEMGLHSVTTITGFISDVHRFLRDVDVFLFTSKEEGFGSTLLEVMKIGLPIVSTSVGGTRDFLIDGKNSLVCPVGDYICLASKVEALIADTSMRRDLVIGGKGTVRDFSAKEMAGKTLFIYQQVLNNLMY